MQGDQGTLLKEKNKRHSVVRDLPLGFGRNSPYMSEEVLLGIIKVRGEKRKKEKEILGRLKKWKQLPLLEQHLPSESMKVELEGTFFHRFGMRFAIMARMELWLHIMVDSCVPELWGIANEYMEVVF
eukprot:Gb_31924 [translate_table: standard]